jgi:lantibiotic biosynthesis protein
VPAADDVRAASLPVAEGIGRRLVDEAIWSGDSCTWIGGDPVDQTDGRFGLTFSALGPWLYSGSSGVALFLAELHRVTGEAAFARAALGAIHHALPRDDEVPHADRLGLYSGWSGVALAGVRVGLTLQRDDLVERAAAVVRQTLAAHAGAGEEFDVVSGHAGALVAALALRNLLHQDQLLDTAERLGLRLLETADATEAGWSWPAPAFPRQRHLTGFSHGAAGTGWALVELFGVTGDERFRAATERAFAYERSVFDPDEGNWPDFREEPATSRRPRRPRRFCVFWCHGAPGIALSRLRALEILQDQACRAEAEVALRTTRRALADALDGAIGNFSLCHGLAGGADVLLHGRRGPTADGDESRDLIGRVVQAGIDGHASPGLPWPCGTHGGETPSLMLGLAGIGSFYLRVADPSVPSFLIMRP